MEVPAVVIVQQLCTTVVVVLADRVFFSMCSDDVKNVI